jgi:hypothetical protein
LDTSLTGGRPDLKIVKGKMVSTGTSKPPKQHINGSLSITEAIGVIPKNSSIPVYCSLLIATQGS